MSKRNLANGFVRPRPPSDLLERNKRADEALTSRYDQLNSKFREIEAHFKSLKAPDAVWVAYGHQELDNGMQYWALLGWAKFNGAWRLCHAYDDDWNQEGMHDVLPITDCTIHARLAAAAHIRELHQAIVNSKETLVPEVDQALEQLGAFCSEAF
jgi:hypothetical protein